MVIFGHFAKPRTNRISRRYFAKGLRAIIINNTLIEIDRRFQSVTVQGKEGMREKWMVSILLTQSLSTSCS